MSARDRITAEALKLFVRLGVDQTTTREIAAAAGIAEGTIYRHFKSKDELAQGLFERNYLAFAGYLERAAQRAASPRERLAYMLSWLCVAAERDSDLFAYLFLAPHGLEARVPPEAVPPMDLLRRAVADAAAPGRSPDLMLAVVTGALFGAVQARRQGRLAHSLIDESPRLVEAAEALLGLSAAEASKPTVLSEDAAYPEASVPPEAKPAYVRGLQTPAEVELAD